MAAPRRVRPARPLERPGNSVCTSSGYHTDMVGFVRAPMTREKLGRSFDQLSWQFVDMSDGGGRLALLWDRELASVAFKIIK